MVSRPPLRALLLLVLAAAGWTSYAPGHADQVGQYADPEPSPEPRPEHLSQHEDAQTTDQGNRLGHESTADEALHNGSHASLRASPHGTRVDEQPTLIPVSYTHLTLPTTPYV